MTTWNEWATLFDLQSVLLPEDRQRPWNPNDIDRETAWELLNEFRSRILTQPLHYRSGNEASALESVYQLFPRVRELLAKKGRESEHFARIALAALNTWVRPFTAKWHKKKEDGKLEIEDERLEFRADLDKLQARLVIFERALRSLAGVEDAASSASTATPLLADPQSASSDGSAERRTRSGTWTPATEFLSPTDRDHARTKEADTPTTTRALQNRRAPGLCGSEVLKLERAILDARRNRSGSKPIGSEDSPGVIGLALSGGGIRSATFCLGVMQSLSKRRILEQVDYLSTVSGGGYVGSFLSALPPNDDSKDPLRHDGPAVRHLRKRAHNHLLGEKPLRGILAWTFTVTRGLVMHLLALLGPVAAVLLLRMSLRRVVPNLWFPMAFWITALSLTVALLIACTIVARRSATDRKPSTLKTVTTCSVILVALAAIHDAAMHLVSHLGDLPLTLGTSSASIGLVLGFLGTWFRKQQKLAALLHRAALAIALPLLAVWGYAELLSEVLYSPHEWIWAAGLLGTMAVSALVWWITDTNITSHHTLYGLRLCETYLHFPQRKNLAVPKLTALDPCHTGAPYHLLNATVNLAASSSEELRGRRSETFVFSKAVCGSATTGYFQTQELESDAQQVDLGTAMAISGAAASSQMGSRTRPGHAPLLALLNIRLGYWLPNLGKGRTPPPRPGIGYLIREAFGLLHEDLPLLNLSDGGHIENLGLHELFRRKCWFIIAVDAEADEGIACGGLTKALRQASIDFGVEVDIDLSDLTRSDEGTTRAHFQLGVVHYPDGDRGYLLYLKSSRTGDEGRAIQEYRRSHPAFPHETTADQFFDEEQFEMYRMLGAHVGERLFHAGLFPTLRTHGGKEGDQNPRVDVTAWLNALRSKLFPGDHADQTVMHP